MVCKSIKIQLLFENWLSFKGIRAQLKMENRKKLIAKEIRILNRNKVNRKLYVDRSRLRLIW